jgi:hypothetical protein
MPLLYCDHCAGKYGYDVDTPKTHKGECQLCHRRLGPMNAMNAEDVEKLINDYDYMDYNLAGFTLEEVEGFPVGTKIMEIEPRMSSHKMMAENCVLFFDAGRIVIANPKTGKRLQVKY